MKKFVFISLLVVLNAFGQKGFTRKDSLRGGLPFARTCYDVQRYDLDIRLDIERKSISGNNSISFKVVKAAAEIQLDLFANMQIDSIVSEGTRLEYRREFDAVFVAFPKPLPAESSHVLRFYYHGNPIIAKRAPWDGGFVFTQHDGKPWVAVAVQGTGASLWFPCKDSQSDEPDLGATIKVAVPDSLMDVSNGRLMGAEKLADGYTCWDWEVKNPINNYDITLNVGDYADIHDRHNALDLDYYVLRGHEERARRQFAQVGPMLDCYESHFGPYPFSEDSFKLVETPYLGMEHQSAVAYGNKFQQGYLGNDLSGTGIGMLFDYILIHESGHEWFGNSITSRDIADMWIHEGFTMYAESVYVECLYGAEKAQQYILGMRRNIENDRPIIGAYGVGDEGSGDMYYKGALMLNTMRHIVGNDELWWKTLKSYAETFRHQIIDTKIVMEFFNRETGKDFSKVFAQYLTTTKIPTFEYSVGKGKLSYRWKNTVDGFDMPVDIENRGGKIRLYPTAKIQKMEIAGPSIAIDPGFLIDIHKQ